MPDSEITDVTTRITVRAPHFIHFFRSNRMRKMQPLKHNSMHMASHTPFRPMDGARAAAIVRRTAQMLNKFIRQGTRVRPAPTKTP